MADRLWREEVEEQETGGRGDDEGSETGGVWEEDWKGCCCDYKGKTGYKKQYSY